MRKIALVLALAAAVFAVDDYASAQRKVEQIEGEKLRAGSRVTFSAREIEAWATHEAPDGVRIRNWSCSPGSQRGLL